MRKVSINHRETSLQDYIIIKSSNPDGLNDLWCVGSENVFELLNSIQIAVSCEYSDFTYYNVKLVDNLQMSHFTHNIDESDSETVKRKEVDKCIREHHKLT